MHFTSSVFEPRSRPANWYSESESGTGVTAPRMVAGSAPSATATGNALARMRQAMVAEIQRAAAMRQPAHDDLVRRDHLLAIDAEVLARLARAARDRQAPGDQRARIARPAGLDRQACRDPRPCLPTRFPGTARC